jgi:hypothetical protein
MRTLDAVQTVFVRGDEISIQPRRGMLNPLR